MDTEFVNVYVLFEWTMVITVYVCLVPSPLSVTSANPVGGRVTGERTGWRYRPGKVIVVLEGVNLTELREALMYGLYKTQRILRRL